MSLKPRWTLRVLAQIVLVTILASPVFAQAAYRLHVGDVLEVGALSIPEFRQRATIETDGVVHLPLAGRVTAVGMTVPEIRSKIEELLANKVFYKKTGDGRSVGVPIAADEIVVSIVEHRPVYVTGDVGKPGEYPFRPGLTIPQVLALAGGVDLARFRVSNPIAESAELRAEYESSWTEFAKAQATQRRLEAELAGKKELDVKGLTEVPLPPSVINQIVRLERDLLTARVNDLTQERASLVQSTQQVERRMAVLVEQKKGEDEGVQADTAEFNRVREAFGKGIVPITRLTESRRILLLSSTRALQAAAQIEQLERERDELGRRVQKLTDQRRIDIMRELQDVGVKAASLRAKLQSTGERLVYSGALRSQFVRGRDGEAASEIVVRRRENGEAKTIQADDNLDLQPGDVIEVTLRLSDVMGAGASLKP